MRIDPDGHVIVGGRFLSPIRTKSLRDDENTTTGTDDLSILTASCQTSWARNVARLCQRVKDAQTLIQEDVREIEEPLATLGTVASTLSQEHMLQWEAAKIAYTQAMLECTQTLERILSPFAEPPEPLEQSRDFAGSIPSRVGVVNR